MLQSADVDLPWYFGSGPSTAAGDAGLKSPLGGQLDALRAGIPRDRTAVDSSRSEDEAIGRLGMGERYRVIEERLGQLQRIDVDILRAHYVDKPMPFMISGAAPLVLGEDRESLTVQLRSTDKGKHLAGKDPKSVELRVTARVAQAKAMYAAAKPVTKAKRVPR
jgi:hypothetical protein